MSASIWGDDVPVDWAEAVPGSSVPLAEIAAVRDLVATFAPRPNTLVMRLAVWDRIQAALRFARKRASWRRTANRRVVRRSA